MLANAVETLKGTTVDDELHLLDDVQDPVSTITHESLPGESFSISTPGTLDDLSSISASFKLKRDSGVASLDPTGEYEEEDSESELEVRSRRSSSGRRKINIEFIEDRSRRHITFSKRKAGIMKKAFELSTLTGTQVLLLVASETGHVYTFATPKLQPLITKPEGKGLIQACLNDPGSSANPVFKENIEATDSESSSGDRSGSSRLSSDFSSSNSLNSASSVNYAAAAALAVQKLGYSNNLQALKQNLPALAAVSGMNPSVSSSLLNNALNYQASLSGNNHGLSNNMNTLGDGSGHPHHLNYPLSPFHDGNFNMLPGQLAALQQQQQHHHQKQTFGKR